MFVALGLILPFFTGQIPKVGSMMLPMHIPVLLCGLICGWKYGLMAGAVLPLLRSALFGMPPLFPTAAAMAFELAAYGFLSGFRCGHGIASFLHLLYHKYIRKSSGGKHEN
jgi:thiamine transporter ThiT